MKEKERERERKSRYNEKTRKRKIDGQRHMNREGQRVIAIYVERDIYRPCFLLLLRFLKLVFNRLRLLLLLLLLDHKHCVMLQFISLRHKTMMLAIIDSILETPKHARSSS